MSDPRVTEINDDWVWQGEGRSGRGGIWEDACILQPKMRDWLCGVDPRCVRFERSAMSGAMRDGMSWLGDALETHVHVSFNVQVRRHNKGI